MLAGGKVRKFSKCSLTFTLHAFLAHSCTICPCYLGMEIYAMQCRDPMSNNKDCRVGQLTNAFSTFQEELDMSRLQVKQLNDLVSEADEIVKVLKPNATTLTKI